ncbi:hypothetical protein ACLOJK_036645, partial [Asimina triloba]
PMSPPLIYKGGIVGFSPGNPFGYVARRGGCNPFLYLATVALPAMVRRFRILAAGRYIYCKTPPIITQAVCLTCRMHLLKTPSRDRCM